MSDASTLMYVELYERKDRLGAELREIRFWLLVQKQKDGCWLWTGFHDKLGYGQFERNTKAHRQAYTYAVGPIPQGKLACHKCDNPPCVNPAHLFLGTMKDNSQDMAAKGRAPRGKLNPKQVRDIRDAVAAGANQRALARRYDVHPMTINRIAKKKTHQKEVMP